MRSKTHTQKSDTKEYALIPVSRHNTRTQSAMEYLMTYGWAILIIAIVLGVLYYLGVFNSANLAPRAQPGSCQVFRPNGPGTTYDAGLSGTCQGELPEYVAQFDGYTSSINAPDGLANGPAAITVALWMYPYNAPPSTELPFTNKWAQQISWTNNNGGPVPSVIGGTTNGGDWIYSNVLYPDKWYFVTLTGTNSLGDILYIDGVQVAANSVGTVASGSANIWMGSTGESGGGAGCCNYGYKGGIANVQVYNTSLSSNEVQALYQEGIGGAPIKLQNLVGWWPLNGNSDDYSGNLNNGVSANVVYTGSWTSGYTAP